MASAAGGRGGRFVMGAAKKVKETKLNHPAFAPLGSVVNAQLKAKKIPAASSQLSQFIGIRDPPRSDISKLISKFIKLNNRQNPGMKKDRLCEEKLWALLEGKERVGIPEITKLLSQQFVKSG